MRLLTRGPESAAGDFAAKRAADAVFAYKARHNSYRPQIKILKPSALKGRGLYYVSTKYFNP
jgi:hypothetical protein